MNKLEELSGELVAEYLTGPEHPVPQDKQRRVRWIAARIFRFGVAVGSGRHSAGLLVTSGGEAQRDAAVLEEAARVMDRRHSQLVEMELAPGVTAVKAALGDYARRLAPPVTPAREGEKP